MKVVILAGGFGTRLAEHTDQIPKPMVEIGGLPILWHIMKGYANHGFNDFAVALGYKGEVIKDFFVNYRRRTASLSVTIGTGEVEIHGQHSEDWHVDLVETGSETQTGGRVKRVAESVVSGRFMLTYGDGVSNIDIAKLLEFHKSHGKLATMTVVRPPARFGAVIMDGENVTRFEEKPQIGEGWINGGFFVLEPEVIDYIQGDQTVWEREPVEHLASDGQLMAYRHDDFWQCMDTLRDLRALEGLWQANQAPWKVW